MRSGRTWNRWRVGGVALGALVVAAAAAVAWAQDSGEGEAAAPSSEEVMRQLLEQREPAPVEPEAVGPDVQPVPSRVEMPATRLQRDPSVLGVAPGQPEPELRREGEFLVARRGRLVRSTQGDRALFVFEADSAQSPEPPMVLQENLLLETMEDIVLQRGDATVFIVSGQVHVYRGANYLLPTMMNIAPDRTNLDN